MSYDMIWAPGWNSMVGSETMLYVEAVGIELLWESPKLPFKEVTFFSRCKGPELQDCLGQTLALIRYGGLGDLVSWGYLGEKLGRGQLTCWEERSLYSFWPSTYTTVTGLGYTRIQASGLPFLKLTCSILKKSRFRLTLSVLRDMCICEC